MEDQEDELIELMGFLAQYVRVVHCNQYFMNKLFLNKGKSYVEVLTASDIAYAITLIKNSHEMWKHKFQNNGDAGGKKPRYSSGEGKKREHGESTWSAEGIKYFQNAEKAWTDAFRKDSRANTVLTLYWKSWIEDEGMTFILGGNQGMNKKTAHSILRTRNEGETKKSARAKKVIEPVEEEEFHYESEVDDNGIVDVGEWSARKGPRPRKEKVVHDIDDDDESGDDEDSEDDDNDSLGGGGGNDEDDTDEGGDNDDNDVNIEQEDDERSLNGIQQLMEDEAVVAGLAKKKGKVVASQAPKTKHTKNNVAIESGLNAKRKTVGVRTKSADKPDDRPPTKKHKKFGKELMDEDITKKQEGKRKSKRAAVPNKRN